jgi:hypothetical protein
VIQLDAWLPDDSPVLFVAARIINPNDAEVPMYWWTNAATPQRDDVRVLAPATSAFATDYGEGISRVTPSADGGVDCTWPARNPRARDFFFDIPPTARHWILSSDSDGDGLAMISSERLSGRKLFVWGNGDGGKHWQHWLSPDGGEYAEIQAGLAQTQYEHLPMPAGAQWSWLEAYGNARLDSERAAADWNSAILHGGERIDALVSVESMDEAEANADLFSKLGPAELLHRGTGWGALESVRRKRAGLPWIDETATPFAADSVTDTQRPWLELLEGHSFIGASSFVSGSSWVDVLESAETSSQTLLHRAVIAHAAGELHEARSLYAVSLAAEATVLAQRGRAMIALDEDDVESGLRFYAAACTLDSGNAWLVIEAATAALDHAVPAKALEFITGFWEARTAESSARGGRIRLLEARAHALDGRVQVAMDILRAGIEVADLREGENGVAELWRIVLPDEPVPFEYEFSMLETGSTHG